MSKRPIIKTPKQINNIRTAGKYLTELLQIMQTAAQPGVTGIELESIAADFIAKHKLTGSFKGYNGFPTNLCISNNDCIVHGIPNNIPLRNGDVLKIDCGITYNKGIADSAITIIVGGQHTNPEGVHLLETTKGGLDHCLQYVQPGNLIREWSSHIHDYICSRDCSIIQQLTGHGVGVAVHEAPHIYNRPHPITQKNTFKPGMVVALEPITALTSTDFYEDANGRDLYTTDGDIGAQWEYTVLITEDGHEVLAGVE